MVLQSDVITDPATDDEYIYRLKEKKADEEDELLTPVWLERMIELDSPPNIYRIVKETDKLDEATAATTESYVDLQLPSFDASSILTDDSDADVRLVGGHSLDRGDSNSTESLRRIQAAQNISPYPIRVPSDVRYEGQVAFSVASVSTRIHLQPRHCAGLSAIFVPKATLPGDRPLSGEYALADTISSFDFEEGGAEECKEEEDDVRSHDEGFAFVYGDRSRNEEDYWDAYNGHYGSRDFSDGSNAALDYALDHESVQGEVSRASMPSAAYQEFSSAKSSSGMFGDNLAEFFESCFSCGDDTLSPTSASRQPFVYRGGSFSPDDYGVSSGSALQSH